MSATTELTLRTWNTTFEKETGVHYTFQLRRLKAYFLEWEDLHFNHDSSVLIADHRDTTQTDDDDNADTDHEQAHITALAVIAAAYRQMKDHPEQKLLLVGHTDRSGDATYNLELSRRRSENLLHLLRGNKEAWAKHTEPTTYHKVEDYQQLLAWLYNEHGWDTDPGNINNKLGPTTKAAVKRFQIAYNQEFKQSISEDGVVGRETWGAFFDIYIRELRAILDVDETGLSAMQGSLNFLNKPEFVGCGENSPITALNRSRTDRRVELFFFDPDEEPTLPLQCHPTTSKCLKDKCELRDEKRYKIEPIPVEPILPPRYRLPVHLTLVWKDPANKDHPFPKDMNVTVSFGDGSNREVKVGEQGVLDFIVDKRKSSFTLSFNHAEASYIVTMPSETSGSASEKFVVRPDLPPLLRAGAHAFLLPPSWNLDNCDWDIDAAKATTYTRPNFNSLETLTEIGTHGSPCRIELKPHWQYMKFLYFDRKLKKKLSVTPMMVEGFIDNSTTSGNPETQSNWTTESEACQCLPWIFRKERSFEKILLQFRTKDATFIDSTAAEASGGGRKLISKGSSSMGTDPGLNEGENSTLDFAVPSAERIAFYDLPTVWKSRAYFTKLKDKSDRFEALAKEETSDTSPFLFSLDDIVLTDATFKPIAWVPDTQPLNRVAIFNHTFSGGSSNIGLYKEDTGNNQGYFTQRPVIETDRNYIADYPDWTRLLITQGNLFDVFDKRVAVEPNGVVGARAGVRWLDATKAPSFIQHKGLHPTGEMESRPGVTDKEFFSIQPMYEQRHHKWWEPSNRTHHRGIGRYDMVLLRCCDFDGDTEISRCMSYFRFFFNFNAGFTPSNNPNGTPLALAGNAANQWPNTAIVNLLRRWNGPDSSWNTGQAQIIPKDPKHKFRASTLWFAQALSGNIAHYELGVFQDTTNRSGVRAYMSASEGQGALDQADNTPSSGDPGWFTFAHEVGHGASLQDEYAEPTTRTNLLAGWLSGFDCFSPGSPYLIDSQTMMNQNKIVDTRDHWHVAEWLRARPKTRFEFDLKHGTYSYSIPHHASTPAQNYICWPLREAINYRVGKHGKFDAFFYPLGDERFSADALPRQVGRQPGPRFDAIIVVVLKLKFDFHIAFNTSTQNNIHNFLTGIDQQIRQRFNNKFFAQGTLNGQHYYRVLLDFSPRYWVKNPGTDYSSADPNDTREHIEVAMKAGDAPSGILA